MDVIRLVENRLPATLPTPGSPVVVIATRDADDGLVSRLGDVARMRGRAVVAVRPVPDAIKEVDVDGRVIRSVDRTTFRLVAGAVAVAGDPLESLIADWPEGADLDALITRLRPDVEDSAALLA